MMHSSSVRRFCAFIVGACVCIGATTARAQVVFTEVSAAAGLTYTQMTKNFGEDCPYGGNCYFERRTGGVAVGDYDGDGWDDLFVTRMDAPSILYRNNGDGTFTDVTEASGISVPEFGNGAGWADIDNDGDLDLLVLTYGGTRHFLFVNAGDGTFTEEAVARGTEQVSLSRRLGTSVAFGDYDRDGWVDIHLTEWVPDRLLAEWTSAATVLLRNRGTSAPGTFEDVTDAAGVRQYAVEAGIDTESDGVFSYGSAFVDLDNDRWPDLLINGDSQSSKLYWNNRDGTFSDATFEGGGTTAALFRSTGSPSGLTFGDYDGDGDLDIFVSGLASDFASIPATGGNRLLRNLGNRIFDEQTTERNVRAGSFGWGAAFLDYDNDGDLDLTMTNGMDDDQLFPEVLGFKTDRMRVWRNNGATTMTERSTALGLTDTRQGKGLAIFDYDRDGDLDIFVVNNGSTPVLYRNDGGNTAGKWLRVKATSESHAFEGLNARVLVTAVAGGPTQVRHIGVSTHFLGQSERVAHFGLGALAGDTVHRVRVRWNKSGITQEFLGVDANAVLEVTAPTGEEVGEGEGEGEAEGEEEGEGEGGEGEEEGEGQAEGEGEPQINDPEWSIARVWNEALLFAIRRDTARPVVHARNLFHLSALMWDSWTTYTDVGDQYYFGERIVPEDVAAARRETMSYACYGLLKERFKNSPGKLISLPHFDAVMAELGYDISVTTTIGDTPAAVGNRMVSQFMAYFKLDGSNEVSNYAASNGYQPVNAAMVVKLGGPLTMVDPNRWQPLAIDFFVDQGGISIGPFPAFIGPHWGSVIPFSLKPWDAQPTTWLDPGVNPRLGGDTDARFKAEAMEVLELTSQLTPDDGVMIDISPAVKGNSPLGTNDYQGHALNPYTGQPYPSNIVKRGDFGRVLAEYWADGPSSETPPGHWLRISNDVSDKMADLDIPFQIGGVGPVLERLEWDVKLFFAMSGAMHDAAVVAWGIKGYYDGVRPISMLRYMSTLGQSSDPELPSYHPSGLPLVPGLSEVITAESSAIGERHAHLATHIGKIAVYTWMNAPQDPANEYTGVGWMLGTSWVPYQRPTFVSPPFAGYISGHSTFSRSGAECLTRFTGSAYFPGGVGIYIAPQNEYLVFEDGPSETVEMQWATYYDAADQSGNSRLWGGIHVRADDFTGRRLGSYIGGQAYGWASQYFASKAGHHTADQDGNNQIDLTELLRVVQFYNSGSLHCDASTEDGYAPGPGDTTSAPNHESDYDAPDWVISLSELLRIVQFYNSGGYHYCGASEDVFCPGV